MGIYKVRVHGDTYEEYDGDVLVETSEKIRPLNRDIVLEYSGPFNMLKILEQFLDKSIDTQFIAYKTAFMKTAAQFAYVNGRFDEFNFGAKISKAPEKLVDRTITATVAELLYMTHKSYSSGWTATSTEDNLMWYVENDVPKVASIQNSVTTFEKNGEKFIVIMNCGSLIRKKMKAAS